VANDIEVSVGYEDIQTLRRELVGVAKDAKSSASVFEREYNKVERALVKTAKANQDYYGSLLKLDKEVKSASSSAGVFIKMLDKEALATERLVAEKDRLAKSFVPLYAQSKLYEQELEKLDRAQELGVLSDKQRIASQQLLNDQFAKGTGIFSTYANQARSSASRMGVVYQQAGYQAGDFFVQVQSGTSILTAFSQQATQMVGMMYLIPEAGMAANISLKALGISASITMAQLTMGLSIAIPVITSLASLFITMSSANYKANESAETSVDIFQRLAQATNQLWVERMKLNDPKFDENLVGTKDKLKELADAYDVATQKVKDLENGFQSLQGRRQAQPAIEAAKQEAIAADIALKAAKEKLDAYQQEVGLAYARERINAQIDAQNEQGIRDLEEQQRLQDEFNRKLAKAHEIYAKTRLEAAGLAQETANAINALNQMKIEFSPGGQTMMKYGSRSPTLTPEQQAFADRNTPKNISVVGSSGGGGGGAGIGGETQEEYIAKLVREYDMKKKSLGLTDEQVKRTEFLFSLDEKLADMKTKRSEVEIETEKQRTIAAYDAYAAAEKQAAIMSTVTSSLENMFMSFVDGTKSVGDAFKGMLRDIILQIYQEQVAKTAATGIGNFLSGLFTSANGNVFQGGSHVSAYANGGVVGSPTYFPMSGGKTGLMGEAGPEAIMPLKRGSNGKLGVQVDGNSGGSVVVNQTFNFSANGDESVKKIIAQAAPQIAQMTQQKIMDSRRRGGSMKAAFG
jgi:hypothetical protein